MRKILVALSAAVVLLGSSAATLAGSAYLILDAKSGRVLAADDADTLNHPASLTKMMTLYMTFEAIHRGKLGWNSNIPVSAHAASMKPTKLGLRPGSSVTVRDAVNGMIVKSANDAAAAMAEALGGSEENFGRMMTQRARQLGMNRTVFVNASGLPDDRQITTARDMSTLGIALINDFPGEYRLFSQRNFTYAGRSVRGHNNLMYRFRGMDGIKTGYTNASGFNIVSAVRDGNRRLVGVVMGGRTARSRDNQMASLLTRYIKDASSSGDQSLVASDGARAKAKTVEVASVGQTNIPVPAPRHDDIAQAIVSASATSAPLDLPGVQNEIQNAGQPDAGRWQLQIAATPSAKTAKEILAKAQSQMGAALLNASPYTEVVGKGRSKVYRARFIGFDSRESATSACNALKKQDFQCLMLPGQG
ncbi:serine hydrolase [Rhizobium sp. RAF56]|uniref:serine hydrolase n=1 Tax=Rhizobium sp. RAF56 TaxID=3233062 RepID=UPI003F965717